jgi:hypothetical protein
MRETVFGQLSSPVDELLKDQTTSADDRASECTYTVLTNRLQ